MSGTMIAAHKAGIPVFVTGGIGGVHRGGENSKKIKTFYFIYVATVLFNSIFFLFPSLSCSNCLFRKVIIPLDHTVVVFSPVSPFQKLQNIPLEHWPVVKRVGVLPYPLLARGYMDIICWCNRSGRYLSHLVMAE